MQKLGLLGMGDVIEKTSYDLRRNSYAGKILIFSDCQHQAESLQKLHGCLIQPSVEMVCKGSNVFFLMSAPEKITGFTRDLQRKLQGTLISFVPGLNRSNLKKLFPQARCFRAVNSFSATQYQSEVALFPDAPDVRRLLGYLGNLQVLTDELDFELATVATCMNGWIYFLLHDLQQWLSEKGLPPEYARRLVLRNLQECLITSSNQPRNSFRALGEAQAKPNSFAANGLAVLNHQPPGAAWGAACEVVLDSLLN
ncbi:pyrroline-5-carboxylate reductase [Pseudomonas sp. NPDC089547]|uniref:pyrroline-5-carboxylate reductase n=1 Tax=Pseudomonas sp. NPDC089547 TaxID=3390652 RepID=UPI003D02DC52